FSTADLSEGKYSALATLGGVHAPPDADADPRRFLDQLGRREPSEPARRTGDVLATHWDRVAQTIRDGRAPTTAALNRLWQARPGWLEDAAQSRPPDGPTLAALQAERAAQRERADELERLLASARDVTSRAAAPATPAIGGRSASAHVTTRLRR